MDDLFELRNIPPEATELDFKAIVAITQSSEAFVITYTGSNRDLFQIGCELFDQGLLPPEGVTPGVYRCTDFYTLNHTLDREGGWVDDWDLKCTWEKLEVGKTNV